MPKHSSTNYARLEDLIGYATHSRPLESFHLYVARLIRLNYLTEPEVRSIFSSAWLRLAFSPDSIEGIESEPALQSWLASNAIGNAEISPQAWLPIATIESRLGFTTSPPDAFVIEGRRAC